MKIIQLRKINDNCHELDAKGVLILFSYDTVVAISLPGVVHLTDVDAEGVEVDRHYIGVYKTEVKYSKTTSAHINKWTATSKTLPQDVLERLALAALK